METHNIKFEPISELLERFNIDQWDVLMIGDGSGSRWGKPCGWGCAVIDRLTGESGIVSGAVSTGTNNVAELMAYVFPLMELAEIERKRHAAGEEFRTRNIHIISDSDYVVGVARKVKKTGTHAMLWSAIEAVKRFGFILTWHHTKRSCVDLNVYTDHIARQSMHLIKDNPVRRRTDEKYQKFSFKRLAKL